MRGGANNEEGRGEGVSTHDEDEAPFTKTMSPKLETKQAYRENESRRILQINGGCR